MDRAVTGIHEGTSQSTIWIQGRWPKAAGEGEELGLGIYIQLNFTCNHQTSSPTAVKALNFNLPQSNHFTSIQLQPKRRKEW